MTPNPRTNPKPNTNSSRGRFSLGAIVWLPPTLKLTLTLTQPPNLIRGKFSSAGGGDNCPDTISSKVVYFKSVSHIKYSTYKKRSALPLNILYDPQTIQLAVQAMAEPLHTWLKDNCRNLLFVFIWKAKPHTTYCK